MAGWGILLIFICVLMQVSRCPGRRPHQETRGAGRAKLLGDEACKPRSASPRAALHLPAGARGSTGPLGSHKPPS